MNESKAIIFGGWQGNIKTGKPRKDIVMKQTPKFSIFLLPLLLGGLILNANAGAVRTGFTISGQMPAADDDSTGLVPIGFTVDFFGLSVDSLYINKNGNVTLDGPLSTYTPGPIANTAMRIIAPFWADVDNRAVGTVTYGTGSVDEGFGSRQAFFVSWLNVGYFNTHSDKVNCFQLVIIDRSDCCVGCMDIEFNYDQVQWETGDASGGSGGLGGSSARAGFSNGT